LGEIQLGQRSGGQKRCHEIVHELDSGLCSRQDQQKKSRRKRSERAQATQGGNYDEKGQKLDANQIKPVRMINDQIPEAFGSRRAVSSASPQAGQPVVDQKVTYMSAAYHGPCPVTELSS